METEMHIETKNQTDRNAYTGTRSTDRETDKTDGQIDDRQTKL